jgi:hypothetical protein
MCSTVPALGVRARQAQGRRHGRAYTPRGKPLLRPRRLLGVRARAGVSRAHALTPRRSRGMARRRGVDARDVAPARSRPRSVACASVRLHDSQKVTSKLQNV